MEIQLYFRFVWRKCIRKDDGSQTYHRTIRCSLGQFTQPGLILQGLSRSHSSSYVTRQSNITSDILGYITSGIKWGVVGWCKGAVYLTSLGRPTDIGLQLGKACYPCSG